MPEIRPFKALRYDFAAYNGDLSKVLAPPYDVLNQADKDALLAKDEHNIVAIDLPHIPPKEEGPQQAYLDAQFALDMWEAQGVLVREQQPAIYAYNQTFEVDGAKYTRHQLIVTMRLHEFEEGVVLPHEKTFGGPKADRLALTKETRCNMSPVFGLYTDPENKVGKAVESVVNGKPDAVANVEGVDNQVWVITDEAIVKQVANVLADKNVFIADGHHRYTTALNYRAHVRDLLEDKMDDNHPANYIMIVLVSMDDPGCVIQGYCRMLSGEGVTAESLKAAWADGVEEVGEGEADLTLYEGKTKSRVYLKFTNRAILDTLAPDRHPSWRKLDVAYLHTYLIDKLAVEKFGTAPTIGYVKSAEVACKRAEEDSSVAVLPNATPMEQLREVSLANELMPQKSTFFYPKLATGWTINSLSTEN